MTVYEKLAALPGPKRLVARELLKSFAEHVLEVMDGEEEDGCLSFEEFLHAELKFLEEDIEDITEHLTQIPITTGDRADLYEERAERVRQVRDTQNLLHEFYAPESAQEGAVRIGGWYECMICGFHAEESIRIVLQEAAQHDCAATMEKWDES